MNKHLVSKEALATVTRAQGAVRQYFYRATLPWGDNGDRILGAAAFMDFSATIASLKTDFDAAVEEFVTVKYPAERARAQFRMGDMFVAQDYPAPEELRARFGISLSVHGIPTGADFRVQMKEDDAARIRQEIDTHNAAKLGVAVKTLWDRVFSTVQHFAERMEGDEKFKSATIDNLYELVDDLPAMNITNDPNLTALHAEIKSRLGGLTAPELRKNTQLRAAARTDAQAIVSKITGIMSSFA